MNRNSYEAELWNGKGSAMSQVGSAIGVERIGSPTYARPSKPAPTANPPTPGASASTSDSTHLTLTRHDLLELNGIVGQSSQVSNALSTAHDALNVIGGLLGNVGAVLTAASSPGDITFDRATDQGRIDSAVLTIDAVASSARFAKQNLLDGTYRAASKGVTLQLPSFASKDLGSNAHPTTSTLTSLTTGGANDLASGQLESAGRILASAMSQVKTTQGNIEAFTGSTTSLSQSEIPPLPAGVTSSELISSAARQMLADPALSAVAVANSDGRNVLALLQP